MADLGEIRLKVDRSGLEFIRRLAEDTDFRERLRGNPAEALGEYGIEVPRDRIPATIDLPPEDEFRAVLEQVGEPDEHGNFEIPPTQSSLYGILWFALEAMVFVADEEDGGHAR